MVEMAADGVVTHCDPKVYLVLHAHTGWKGSLGSVPMNAANTHRKEIIADSFPDLPDPPYVAKCDQILVKYCNNVDAPPGTDIDSLYRPGQKESYGSRAGNAVTTSLKDVFAALPDKSVKYFALFCHSGHYGSEASGYANAAFFHPISAPWANLHIGNIAAIDPVKFDEAPQIRIFGCYAAYGVNSLCEILSKRIPGSTCYGFNFHGGAYGTNDQQIGHGLKAVPSKPPNPSVGDTWFATYSPGAKSTFRKFP